MSVGAILTLGYGSFGSINLLPTIGLGPLDSVSATVGGGGVFHRRRRILHLNHEARTPRAVIGEQIEPRLKAADIANRIGISARDTGERPAILDDQFYETPDTQNLRELEESRRVTAEIARLLKLQISRQNMEIEALMLIAATL